MLALRRCQTGGDIDIQYAAIDRPLGEHPCACGATRKRAAGQSTALLLGQPGAQGEQGQSADMVHVTLLSEVGQ